MPIESRSYSLEQESKGNTGAAVLPKDFSLPDLSPPAEEYSRKVVVEFPLTYRGQAWPGQLTFELNRHDNERIGQLYFRILDPATRERVSNFGASMNRTNPLAETRWQDERGSACLIFNRNVENKSLRRQGLGELSMRVIEEVVRMVNQVHPELKMDKMYVFTQLGALSKLLVSRDWLQKNNVTDIKTNERDLGYIPYPADEAKALRLLRRNSSELEHIEPTDLEVLFIKKLSEE